MSGHQQYLRVCKVTFEGGGKELDVSQMRVRFDTHQKDLSTPHYVNIYISNLSKDTVKPLLSKEYKEVTLAAGYEASAGVIFKGEILQVRVFRESVTDIVTHVLATSAQRARNFAIVNKSLAAGHTFRDRVDVAVEALKQYGVQVGHIDDLGSKKFPRGFACFGMAKDLLREVCFATNSSWHINNGTFNLVKNDGTLPGDVTVINAGTGMVWLPEQTINGIVVRCLLNYKLRPAQKIKLDNSTILQAAYDPGYLGAPGNDLFSSGGLSLSADGIYKVLLVEHNGDTRGPNWYTELACVKADGGYSPALISRGIGDYEETGGFNPATGSYGTPTGDPPNSNTGRGGPR